jgi:outer membrane receptor for ferrienterochelin and colicins
MDRENLVFPDTEQTEVERDINVFWLQQEFALGSRLKLTGGFRYDDNSDFGSEFSPKAGAVFTAAEGHRLRASYGHGFRAPRFGELYIDLGPFFKGNPDLLPVISDNWTAGYAYSGSRVQASLDYFDYTLENLVTFDFSGFPFSPITYGNIEGKSKSTGVNANLAVNLPGGFTPSIAYTYNTREDEDGEAIGGFPPPHSVHLKLLWANPRLGVRANLRGNIIGEEDPVDDTFTPAHNVWDFHLSKAITTQGAYAFRLFVQVDNLLDEGDIFRRDAAGEPIAGDLQIWIPPRTFLAGVTIDMDWAR